MHLCRKGQAVKFVLNRDCIEGNFLLLGGGGASLSKATSRAGVLWGKSTMDATICPSTSRLL